MAPDIMAISGSLGIGLVWGWLVATRLRGLHRPIHSWFRVFAASAVVAASVELFSGWISVFVCAVAATLAAGAHAIWQNSLARETGRG